MIRLLFWLSLPVVFLVGAFHFLFLFPTSDGLEVGLAGFTIIVPTTAMLLVTAKDRLSKAISGMPKELLDRMMLSALRIIGISICLADMVGIVVLKRGFTEYIAGGGLIIVEPVSSFTIPPIVFVIFFTFVFGYLIFLMEPESFLAGPLLYSTVVVTSVLWNPAAAQFS